MAKIRLTPKNYPAFEVDINQLPKSRAICLEKVVRVSDRHHLGKSKTGRLYSMGKGFPETRSGYYPTGLAPFNQARLVEALHLLGHFDDDVRDDLMAQIETRRKLQDAVDASFSLSRRMESVGLQMTKPQRRKLDRLVDELNKALKQ